MGLRSRSSRRCCPKPAPAHCGCRLRHNRRWPPDETATPDGIAGCRKPIAAAWCRWWCPACSVKAEATGLIYHFVPRAAVDATSAPTVNTARNSKGIVHSLATSTLWKQQALDEHWSRRIVAFVQTPRASWLSLSSLTSTMQAWMPSKWKSRRLKQMPMSGLSPIRGPTGRRRKLSLMATARVP
jgi:hypothetical protein